MNKKTNKAPAPEAKGVKETVQKIKDVVQKVPGWLKRVKAELERLVKLLEKLVAEITRIETAVEAGTATKADKANLRLLKKQAKAMTAYKAVLEERVAKA